VGEVQLVAESDLVALADAEAGGGPFADAIHGEDGGLVEGRGEERAGGVGFVVLGEDVAALVGAVQGLVHLAGQVQLLLEPDGQAREELAESAGGVGQVGLQEAFEFEQGLLIEDDVVEVLRTRSGGLEAVVHGMGGEPAVVLDPREPLLLGGRDDLPVPHEGGGAVVIECRDAEDVHVVSWSDRVRSAAGPAVYP